MLVETAEVAVQEVDGSEKTVARVVVYVQVGDLADPAAIGAAVAAAAAEVLEEGP
jgi:hypothetical protein